MTEKFTDLSKPLEIYDRVKYDAAIRAIVNILFFNSTDVSSPLATNKSVSHPQVITIPEPGL
jgi:hypothetical protein